MTPAARGRHVSFHRGLLVTDIELDPERGMMVATDGETTLRDAADEHDEMLKHAWLTMLWWLAADPGRMAAAITAPGVRTGLLAKIAGDITNKALPQTPFDEWPVFRLHTQRRAEHDASAAKIVGHFGEGTLPTVSPGVYDTSIDCIVASEKDRALLERVANRSCVPPRPPPRPKSASPAVDTAPVLPVGAETDDDLLSALREIMPSARNVEAAPPATQTLRLPVAPPARVNKRAPSIDPVVVAPPNAAPVDPDDILGPIRYLMTQSIERQAADEIARLEAKANAEALATEASRAFVALDALAAVNAQPLPGPRPPDTAWDKLVGMFKKPLAEVPGDHPLATMGRRVTENLYVAGLQLRFGESGDAAVRFEKRTTTLVVNPEHPTVRVLVENGDVVPLIAAAFSEINRELKVVSDEEERRALGRLLLDSPAS